MSYDADRDPRGSIGIALADREMNSRFVDGLLDRARYRKFVRDVELNRVSTLPGGDSETKKLLLQKYFERFGEGGKQDITAYSPMSVEPVFRGVLRTARKSLS